MHPFFRLIFIGLFFLAVLTPSTGTAKIDLVTLETRQSVQTTIYNTADLTLVRDKRVITFKPGINQLQFSWADTRIDPTSLNLIMDKTQPGIKIRQISYPPRTRAMGIWEIESPCACQVSVEISYFTSGLSWQAFYMVTLAPDHDTADVKGFVKVTNQSGETYENAQTRLVVGRVRVLDRIAELAAREYPYGRPQPLTAGNDLATAFEQGAEQMKKAPVPMMADRSEAMAKKPKQIEKKGLSEYFLYTIEGTETIPDKWSKRLPSFSVPDVPVDISYRHHPERWGNQVVRFLTFKNDKTHHLGQTPLPGGMVKVFAQHRDNEFLDYVGADRSPYIPLDDKVELNLGSAVDIQVNPVVTAYAKTHIEFDKQGNISGFDEIKRIKITVNNLSSRPADVEITREIGSPHFDIQNHDNPGTYEKEDMDTIKYRLTLPAGATRTITYTLTVYQGERRWHH